MSSFNTNTFNSLIRGMAALADMHYERVEPLQFGIVLSPANPKNTHLDGKAPVPSGGPSDGTSCFSVCPWEAKLRFGGGRWGNSVGLGLEPAEALTSLFLGQVDAHRVRDAYRRQTFHHVLPLYETLKPLHKPMPYEPDSPAAEWYRPASVTCNAQTRLADGYVTVGADGEVLVEGRPLSEVQDPDMLRWVTVAVAKFLATGQRSPVPGIGT